jgi:hypothetical protein
MTDDRETRSRRGRVAAAVALLLPLASLAAVWTLVERPCWPRPARRTAARRAAVAIRDDVVAFQKWGTRAFTLPYLERGYDRVWYFTSGPGRDGRAELGAAVAEAARSAETVDLFLLAHGNDYVATIEGLDRAATARLRLVYNTGCGDADEATRWRALGADAFVGHVGTSESPVFFVYFLRRWLAGDRLGEAVAASNAATARLLSPVAWAEGGESVDGTRAVLDGAADLTIGG